MKVAFGLLLAFAFAVGPGVVVVDSANAGCVGSPCGAVLVPAPNPIPLRRLKVVPAPAPLPCGTGCVNGVNAYAAPPPCGQSGCGGTAFVIIRSAFIRCGRSPATPPAIPASAIAIGGETADTIPSAAASAISPPV
jgi:hypothetical protein